MSRRKNNEADCGQEPVPQDPREALRNFVVENRIRAFVTSFAPASNEIEADRVFTTSDLRKYFDAYPKTVGDPLAVYIDDYLVPIHHFSFVTSAVMGEPVIPVKFADPLGAASLIG